MSKRPKADDAKPTPEHKSQNGVARVWVLRDGHPEAVTVKAGFSNGRVTQISGAGLTEGAPIITRVATSPL